MRILHIISTFAPAFAFGGPPKVTMDLCRELVRRGHDVHVFTTNAYDQKYNFKIRTENTAIDGIKVYYFQNLLRVHNLFVSPMMISKMRETLRSFDIIHSHFGRQPYDIYVGLFAKRFGIPYIIQAHGALPQIGKRKYFKILFDTCIGKNILQNSSKVIALSSLEAEQYKRMGVSEEKIAIIPNGIDLREYANLPPKGAFKKKFNIPEYIKIILYLGRIHRSKGIELLVRAYAYLRKMGVKDIILVIAGPDDGYLNEVNTLVKSLDVADSTIFTGFISDEDKLKALVDAEVFVTPSFYGFPITFLEACTTGTPIVTTNLGDILEWIDGKVGYVTPPTPHDMANAIHNIISDDGLRRRFSENCLDIVKSSFSIENVVSRLEDIYKEVFETDHLKPR